MHEARYADLFVIVQKEIVALGRRSLSDLAIIFGAMIPIGKLEQHAPGRRARVYTTVVTFWAFLSQVLGEFSSCREAVQKVAGIATGLYTAGPRISQNTSGYCQARGRLEAVQLGDLNDEIVAGLEARVTLEDLWKGRRVRLVDGSGITLADTPENQKAYPQPRTQKQGCGFPLMKVVGLFSLATGALCQWAAGNKHQNDMSLFSGLGKFLEEGDLLMGDRGFCSCVVMSLLQARGVDCVFRLHQRRPTDFRGARRLGKNDWLVTWAKPKVAPKWLNQEDFSRLPETLTVRLLRILVKHKGYRTRQVYLATTLLDATVYTHEDLAELYRRRWQVELFFRDLKTTMGMERLPGRTPAMIGKELAMGAIAYNLVRALIFEAASKMKRKITEISFKATMTMARSWSGFLVHGVLCGKSPTELVDELLNAVAAGRVYQRPGRSEPRAVKRRPKNYQRLTAPRHAMRPIPHRGKRGRSRLNARA